MGVSDVDRLVRIKTCGQNKFKISHLKSNLVYSFITCFCRYNFSILPSLKFIFLTISNFSFSLFTFSVASRRGLKKSTPNRQHHCHQFRIKRDINDYFDDGLFQIRHGRHEQIVTELHHLQGSYTHT